MHFSCNGKNHSSYQLISYHQSYLLFEGLSREIQLRHGVEVWQIIKMKNDNKPRSNWSHPAYKNSLSSAYCFKCVLCQPFFKQSGWNCCRSTFLASQKQILMQNWIRHYSAVFFLLRRDVFCFILRAILSLHLHLLFKINEALQHHQTLIVVENSFYTPLVSSAKCDTQSYFQSFPPNHIWR